jgi:SAM-dependent methyltransferase
MRRSLRRSVGLFRAFRAEQSDPERFYSTLADDTVAVLRAHLDLQGVIALDVGGGAGDLARALAGAGALCSTVEPKWAELRRRGEPPQGSVLASGYELPIRDGAADLVVSSNVLEHVSRPFCLIEEMTRVTRPGGIVWISFTNWLSPWGGHETSPWHYLGGHRAARLYQARYGRPPKNLYGETLYPLSLAAVLAYVARDRDLEVLARLPRYYPSFARGIVEIPCIRELATWNLELLLRRRAC